MEIGLPFFSEVYISFLIQFVAGGGRKGPPKRSEPGSLACRLDLVCARLLGSEPPFGGGRHIPPAWIAYSPLWVTCA